MIIVMTNRQLPEIPLNDNVDIEVKSLGVVLSEREAGRNALYTGRLSDDGNSVTFVPKGRESSLLSHIEQASDKSWVFFIHGFHQDPEENINKALSLSKNHNVNIIVFAWPSRPESHTLSETEIISNIGQGILSGKPWPAALLRAGIDVGMAYLKDTSKNYKPAQRNARDSKLDLLKAFNIVNNEFKLEPSLLVHSMGNYLLKNVVLEEEDDLPIRCNNIVLHQADVNAFNHEWVKELYFNLVGGTNLYITTNVHDFVLSASSIRKTLKNKKNIERLGQTKKNYLVGKIKYLDFSYGEHVNNEHEFFKLNEKDTNRYVYGLLKTVLNGQIDELPAEKSAKNDTGFTRMPTKVLLYQLTDIIHPADTDGAGDEDTDSPTISPLDIFVDPLEPIEEDDSEDEGY